MIRPSNAIATAHTEATTAYYEIGGVPFGKFILYSRGVFNDRSYVWWLAVISDSAASGYCDAH